ncbi:MAG: AraC family transcriptional regulator [Bacillota bacterium]|nr:AraC family transcriptional regulator [Bacillota bacterium]MDW7730049.1 AraC family transcriptional regulator [Bacillota bacterium]
MEKSLAVINELDQIYEPEELVSPDFEIYNSSNVDILITHKPIDVVSYEHAHEGYEFFIPFSYSPHLINLKADQAIIVPRPGMIVPTNPGQPHGVIGEFTIYNSLCLYIQKDYIQQTAHSLTGIKKIHFKAEAKPFSQNLQLLVDQFVEEARAQQTGHRFILESISMQLVIELLRNTQSNVMTRMNRKEIGVRENILKAIEYLNDNYNQQLSNSELFKIANLSPYYFIRLFKKETGKTPHEYLVHLKIDKAKEMLTFSNYSITEICFLCGFSEHSHFSKVFKKLTGISPINYRKKTCY